MITVAYVQMMARYNAWQNAELYSVAGKVSDTERRKDRGAFFGSIHATLNHLLWADQIWMSRFSDVDPPPGGIETSTNMHAEWPAMETARVNLDRIIQEWTDMLDPEWLKGDMTWYSSVAKRSPTMPKGTVVAHFFNHQTHHRGQIHAMLTATGAKTQDTDLLLLPGIEPA